MIIDLSVRLVQPPKSTFWSSGHLSPTPPTRTSVICEQWHVVGVEDWCPIYARQGTTSLNEIGFTKDITPGFLIGASLRGKGSGVRAILSSLPAGPPHLHVQLCWRLPFHCYDTYIDTVCFVALLLQALRRLSSGSGPLLDVHIWCRARWCRRPRHQRWCSAKNQPKQYYCKRNDAWS